jgi:iron(III) transport system permease protein
VNAVTLRSSAVAPSPPRERNDWFASGLLYFYGAAILVAVFIPMAMLLIRSAQDPKGAFIGLGNYRKYFDSPALLDSFSNSFFVAFATAVIVIPIAFLYAYGLSRTCMKWKGVFRAGVFVPLLIPGLLKAIALIYLFGNQGIFKDLLFGASIYGAIGVITASVLWTFPHAVLIITVSLLNADRRLYQAAEVLQANTWRTFMTVTWPACRYGLITAFLAVFVMVFTDFGIAKVIGGNLNLLATDIYKEVVGQQNFEMGAVISVVLLLPAVAVFVLERIAAGKQALQMTGRSLPLVPTPSVRRDWLYFLFCAVILSMILLVLGMAQFAALIKFWPYNLSFTFSNYVFDMQGVGWINFWNSIRMSLLAATGGTIVIFVGATLIEKTRCDTFLRKCLQLSMLLPMAIPGLVLGLAYLLFVNNPGNPLGFLYGTMAILVISTVTHLYTVPHLTALTALKGLSKEVELVSQSLNTPIWRTFFKVTVPACAAALLDIWLYLFLRAMTTLSAVIFLYTADTKLAAIAVIHVDETGYTASAAAMGMLVVYACLIVRLAHYLVSVKVLKKFQSWRQ